MFRKVMFALVCFATVATTSVVMAAPGGVMICTENVGGVWKGDSCTYIVPSYPCSEVQDLCDNCGCWDVSSKIDPNSKDPDKVKNRARVKKAKAAKTKRRLNGGSAR